LLCGFAGAVDGLRKAASNLTVMVDAGEAKVLKRKMAELFNRIFDTDVAGLDSLK